MIAFEAALGVLDGIETERGEGEGDGDDAEGDEAEGDGADGGDEAKD